MRQGDHKLRAAAALQVWRAVLRATETILAETMLVFADLRARAAQVCLCKFTGCTAKSGQLFSYVLALSANMGFCPHDFHSPKIHGAAQRHIAEGRQGLRRRRGGRGPGYHVLEQGHGRVAAGRR